MTSAFHPEPQPFSLKGALPDPGTRAFPRGEDPVDAPRAELAAARPGWRMRARHGQVRAVLFLDAAVGGGDRRDC
jgi:hypothetical protein